MGVNTRRQGSQDSQHIRDTFQCIHYLKIDILLNNPMIEWFFCTFSVCFMFAYFLFYHSLKQWILRCELRSENAKCCQASRHFRAAKPRLNKPLGFSYFLNLLQNHFKTNHELTVNSPINKLNKDCIYTILKWMNFQTWQLLMFKFNVLNSFHNK